MSVYCLRRGDWCIDDMCNGGAPVCGGPVMERCDCGELYDPEEGSECEACEAERDARGESDWERQTREDADDDA